MRRRTDTSPQEQDKSVIVLGSRSHRHLAHSVLLDEAIAPRYIRITMFMLAAALAIFVAWAAVSKLEEVASAPGQVAPAGSVQVLQHVDGGAITKINVIEGQRVTQGELLIALDRVETEAELKVAEARYWSLVARVERLKAQADERWEEDRFGELPPAYADMGREQREILLSHRRASANQEAIVRAQGAQLEAELAKVVEQIANVEREVGILREVADIRSDLEKDRLVTKVQSLETQRTLVVQEGELKKLRGQRRTLQASVDESRARLRALASDRRQQSHDDMGTASAELAQVSEMLVKLKKRLSRTDIVAPVSGIVQDLKFRTVGGVVPPAAVVMHVVPVEDRMQAEVRISTTDVGHVKPGQLVRVKFLTYDFLRYGTLEGTVEKVSATSFADDKGVPYFLGIVRLSGSQLGRQPINPGMTVVCDIVTDQKTVLQYLVRPVAVALKQGLRER